jgi:hypothetical protein
LRRKKELQLSTLFSKIISRARPAQESFVTAVAEAAERVTKALTHNFGTERGSK